MSLFTPKTFCAFSSYCIREQLSEANRTLPLGLSLHPEFPFLAALRGLEGWTSTTEGKNDKRWAPSKTLVLTRAITNQFLTSLTPGSAPIETVKEALY